jgi:RHS repeat-associated protein
VVTRTAGGVEWRYVYDPENRLKEVWRGAERVASFRYDPEGNRVVREVAGLRTVVVDEGYEVRGGVVRKVYWLGGERVAVREGSTVDAAVGDHLGSVTVLAQGGNVAGATRYLPYGAIRWESGLWSTDRRFTGQRWEANLGLYDYRARFYDPTLGRFLQPDSLIPQPGDVRAWNRYTYAYNNPLRYVDGGGNVPVVPLLVAGAVVILKVMDYGWTAWDVYQSGRTLANPLAKDEEKLVAGVNLALAVGLEAAELEEWLPVSLPLDDLGRRALVAGLRERVQQGGLRAGVAFLREAVGEAAPQVIRQMYDRGLFRGIRSAGEWEAILQGVRQEAGLEVHHLIERRFAERLGLRESEIPAVVLDREFHQQEVTARLFQALPTNKSNYTAQEIWNAYTAVYGRDLKRQDWLEAIWPYFERLGVKR